MLVDIPPVFPRWSLRIPQGLLWYFCNIPVVFLTRFAKGALVEIGWNIKVFVRSSSGIPAVFLGYSVDIP